MGGAQPLGATMARSGDPLRRGRPEPHRAAAHRCYLDEATASLDDAVDRVQSAAREGRALSGGPAGNAAEVIPSSRARRALRSRHRPDRCARPAQRLRARRTVRRCGGGAPAQETRTSTSVAPLSRLRSMSATWPPEFVQGGAMFSTTATTYEGRRNRPASKMRSHTRASSRPIFGRSSAVASGPSGGPCCRETRRTSRRSTGRCEALPGRLPPSALARPRSRARGVPGAPARICWLGYGVRAAGLAINELVSSGAVSAPVVIGRDHLDSGSVASPYPGDRGDADGSDAIADWPILNALLNTAAGATWVSVHHGGGVGIGNSIHAGMVVVADGTDDAAERLERVSRRIRGLA